MREQRSTRRNGGNGAGRHRRSTAVSVSSVPPCRLPFRTLLALALAAALSAADARPGTVTFSDGTSWQGQIAMASGARLQLHDGHAMRTIDPAAVAELRFAPDKEGMERAFTMPEPGKPIRVETGEPYPLRELATRVVLLDGTVIPGHLYATAVTVDVPAADGGDAQRRRLPVPAKQRGKPGQRLDELTYITAIAFARTAEAGTAGQQRVAVAGGADELGAVVRDGLVPLAVEAVTPGVFACAPAFGAPVVWAARRGGQVRVGWPGDDPALRARIQALVPALNEFFDRRDVVAAWQAPGTADVYTLMDLERTRPTTDGPHHPWHAEVWRWRLDGDRALLAGRALLLLQRLGAGDHPPSVATIAGWDAAQPTGGVLRLEGWP